MIKGLNSYDEVATTVVTKQALSEVTAPGWARVLLGCKVGINNVTPTNDESVAAKFMIESNDVGILPQEMLAAPMSGVETDDHAQMCPLPTFYVLNHKIGGGETIKPQVQVLASSTGVVVAQMDLIFGQEGDILPSYLDPHPGVARFHQVGTLTVSADDLATGTAYTVVGGDYLRKAYGITAVDTADADKSSSGFFRLESDGFGSSPIEYQAVGIGTYSKTATGAPMGPIAIAEEYQNMPMTRVTVIQDYFYQLGGTAITTDIWVTGVEFSRAPAWY